MNRTIITISFALAIIAFAARPALSDGACSDVALTIAKSKPPQVQFLTATAIGYSGAKLTWTLFASVCAPVTHVRVQRQPLNGPLKVVYNYPPEQPQEAQQEGSSHSNGPSQQRQEAGGSPTAMLEFSDHGLTPTEQYTYYVCATNSFGTQGCKNVVFTVPAPPPAPMPDPEKPSGVSAFRKDKSTATAIWKSSAWPANATDSFQIQFLNAASLAAVAGMANPPFQVQRSNIDRNLRTIDFYAPLPPKPLVLVVRVCAVNVAYTKCSDATIVSVPTFQLAPSTGNNSGSSQVAPQQSP
jgi:hypothetical protein